MSCHSNAHINLRGQTSIWKRPPIINPGQQFALAIVVVGRAGKTEIPAAICSGNDFEEMASYVKLLNSEREARWQTGESRAIPEVA
jgi:hypothetical protein